MASEPEFEPTRDTPPKQRTDDETVADRRLSQEQKRSVNDQPAPGKQEGNLDLPDPKDVGEAG
jgi:hypothetical protein